MRTQQKQVLLTPMQKLELGMIGRCLWSSHSLCFWEQWGKKNLSKWNALEYKSWNSHCHQHWCCIAGRNYIYCCRLYFDVSCQSHYPRQEKRNCVPSHQDCSSIVCLVFPFPSEKEKMALAFVLKTKLWVGCGGSCLLGRSCSKASARTEQNSPLQLERRQL